MTNIKGIDLLAFGVDWTVCDLVVRRHRASVYLSIRVWPCSFLNPCFLSIMLEVWLGWESAIIASGDATLPVGSDFPSSVKKGFIWFLILWQGISPQRAMCQIIVAIKATCPIKSVNFLMYYAVIQLMFLWHSYWGSFLPWCTCRYLWRAMKRGYKAQLFAVCVLLFDTF